MGASNSRSGPVLQFPQEKGPIFQKFTEGGENARIKYAVSSMQGWLKNAKDGFAAVPDLDELTSFFGVYDGHEGAEVALLCATQFHIELRNHPEYKDNLSTAMKRTFFRMDELLEQSDEWKELLPRGPSGQCLCLRPCICAQHWPFRQTEETPYIPPQESGSTACVAAIRGHQIFIGNVGNSRCIISRNGQAIELTTAHNPNHEIERERINRAGGLVTKDRVRIIPGNEEGFFQHQGSGIARINGILTHSRVIGDFAFKCNKDLPPEEQMATCDPELLTVDITNDIEFLVIVSDGVCPFLTSQGVVDFIRFYLALAPAPGRRRIDLRTICEKLCDRTVISADNVTAILVQFKDASRAPPPAHNAAAAHNAVANNNSNNAAAANNNNAAPPAPAQHPAPAGAGNNNNAAPQAQHPAPAGAGNNSGAAQPPAPAGGAGNNNDDAPPAQTPAPAGGARNNSDKAPSSPSSASGDGGSNNDKAPPASSSAPSDVGSNNDKAPPAPSSAAEEKEEIESYGTAGSGELSLAG